MNRSVVRSIAVLLLLAVSAFAADPKDSADKIVNEAVAQAAQQHKIVFLDFTATWCSNCHLLDSYMAAPEIKPIIDKYFVVTHVNFMEEAGRHPERNTPGSDKLYVRLGGAQESGVPFFAFLDSTGKLIVNSNAPKTGNVGYPVAPEEIDWFMEMVRKAVPNLSADEAGKLEKALRERAKQLT